MPGRVARSSLRPAKKSTPKSIKATKKRKQRSLNAYAIAEKEAPELHKIRHHRLGENEDEEPRRKKRRMSGDDDDEEDSRHLQNKKVVKGIAEDLDVDTGSDSEGHEWRMGEVGEEDDSDLDSDEAFGESDEERFEGFTFRGSSSGNNNKKKKGALSRRPGQVDLNEDEGDEEGREDEESLGEDAVDLATMLDDEQGDISGADSLEIPNARADKQLIHDRRPQRTLATREDKSGDSFGGFDDADEEGDFDEDADGVDEAPSEYSDDDDGAMSDYSLSNAGMDDNDPAKLRQLRNLAASIAAEDVLDTEETAPKVQRDSAANAARMINALKTMSGMDPELTRSMKKLSRAVDGLKGDTPDGVVRVPLPKRQQDRVDRVVSYQKAKETLNRWIDTVKHNRRAEHLTFPLQDPEAQEAQGASRMLPTTSNKPQTELESTIQDILRVSGIGGSNNKSEEDQLREFEELQANKMPLEEVKARQAELRKARDLLFREERRAKRISKIKSKAYRRVHRREAERDAQKQRDLMAAAGIEMSEDEKEANDRRRAEERMGARHRESRWAKSVKVTGRAAWDDDARDAVTEMARKNDDLRRRMEGKPVRNEDDLASGPSDESEEEDEDTDGEASGFKLRQQVDKLQSAAVIDASKSGLGALKFMQRADAARKQRNDKAVEQLRRDLYEGEQGSDEEEQEPAETSLGRRIFGPTKEVAPRKAIAHARNELEEGYSSHSEHELDVQVDRDGRTDEAEGGRSQSKDAKVSVQKQYQRKLQQTRISAKPFVEAANTNSSDARPSETEEEELTVGQSTTASAKALNTNGWTTVSYDLPAKANHTDRQNLNATSTMTTRNKDSDADASDNEEADQATDPFLPSNADLVRLAFGDTDADASFAAEKEAAAASEDDQTIDTALPGWGSWTGTGISKRELKRIAQRNAGRFIKITEPGVKPQSRKDTKLKDVIVSEKRVKKNSKYLAEMLPHPFESRAQYERSLRVPVGPEWNTKVVFQDATKPRVMVKRGVIIEPMRTPMI